MTNETNHLTSLADRYAVMKAEADDLAKRIDALRKEILATGRETIEGELFAVTVGLSERSTLDTKACKEFLTEEQVAACTKTTVCETLRIKASLSLAA